VGCDCQRQKQWTQWDGPTGQTENNKRPTTASTFHYVEAVALYIYPQHNKTEERGIQRGYFILETWLLCTQHSKILTMPTYRTPRGITFCDTTRD
jgi:hypothetical protein